MNCDQLETHLYPYLDGEYEAPERLVVEAHLANCRDCAAVVADEVRFRSAFRERMRELPLGTGTAPDQLRQAIRQGIQQETRRARGQQLVRLGAAAVVLITAGGVLWTLRPDTQRPYLDDAAQRHARGLPYEIEQASPEHVEAWFTGKLDHRVAVPRLPNLAVSGARIANVRDRPAAYITYEARNGDDRPRRVGLFVFTDSQGKLDANQLPAVTVDSSHGYNVALWRDGEIVYELVSDLDEDDIRQLLSNTARGERLEQPAQLVRQEAPVKAEPLPHPEELANGVPQLAVHQERAHARMDDDFSAAQPQVGRVRHANQVGPSQLLFTPPPMSHPQLIVRPVSSHASPR